MILQHNCHCKEEDILIELADASILQHRKYAERHGYVYEVSDGNMVPKEGWSGQGYVNKVLLLFKMVLAELDRENPVEWIL